MDETALLLTNHKQAEPRLSDEAGGHLDLLENDACIRVVLRWTFFYFDFELSIYLISLSLRFLFVTLPSSVVH